MFLCNEDTSDKHRTKKFKHLALKKSFWKKLFFLKKIPNSSLLACVHVEHVFVGPTFEQKWIYMKCFCQKEKKIPQLLRRPKLRKMTLLGMHNQPEPRRQNNKEGPQVESWSTSLTSKKKTLWYFGWRDWNLEQLNEKKWVNSPYCNPNKLITIIDERRIRRFIFL